MWQSANYIWRLEWEKLPKYVGCIDAYVKKAWKNRKKNDEKVCEKVEKARPIIEN